MLLLVYFVSLIVTGARGADDIIPHPIKISSGLFLRPVADNVFIYQQSVPIIFDINFEFTKTQQFNSEVTHDACSNPSESPSCTIIPTIHTSLQHIQNRIDTLQHSFSNFPVSRVPYKGLIIPTQPPLVPDVSVPAYQQQLRTNE